MGKNENGELRPEYFYFTQKHCTIIKKMNDQDAGKAMKAICSFFEKCFEDTNYEELTKNIEEEYLKNSPISGMLFTFIIPDIIASVSKYFTKAKSGQEGGKKSKRGKSEAKQVESEEIENEKAECDENPLVKYLENIGDKESKVKAFEVISTYDLILDFLKDLPKEIKDKYINQKINLCSIVASFAIMKNLYDENVDEVIEELNYQEQINYKKLDDMFMAETPAKSANLLKKATGWYCSETVSETEISSLYSEFCTYAHRVIDITTNPIHYEKCYDKFIDDYHKNFEEKAD